MSEGAHGPEPPSSPGQILKLLKAVEPEAYAYFLAALMIVQRVVEAHDGELLIKMDEMLDHAAETGNLLVIRVREDGKAVQFSLSTHSDAIADLIRHDRPHSHIHEIERDRLLFNDLKKKDTEP